MAECRLWIVAGSATKGWGSTSQTALSCTPHPHLHPCSVFSPPEMTTLPCFRLKIALCTPKMPEVTARLSMPPTVQRLDLHVEDPATLRRPGSFNYNWESGKYLHEWANMAEFDAWQHAKELAYSIELIVATIAHGKTLWMQQRH